MTPALIQLLQRGLQARQQGQPQAARAHFLEVLQHEPEQADALLLLGDLAKVQGQLNEADAWLARATRAAPRHAPAWSRWGDVLDDLGRWDQAEACYRRATELNPALLEAAYNRARLLRQTGSLQAAAQALEPALALAPAGHALLPQMLQLKALILEESEQLQAALETLDTAIGLAANRAALHHNRGALLQRMGQSGLALQALDQAIALGLDGADTHYNRGNSLQGLGRLPEALAAYRDALTRNPLHALALFDIARLRWRLGDPAFADELDAAVQASPESPIASGIKGRLLLRGERYAEAATAYEQALKRANDVSGYHDGLGQALARLGRYDEARTAHERAVELAPEHASTHISMAGTLLQAGLVEEAVQAAQAAVRLDPLDQQAWAFLGLAWRACGDPRDAWLNDYQAHVQAYDLPPPQGWPDMAQFNAALVATLQTLHADAQAPIDQTLRSGTQTVGNLFDREHSVIKQLQASIDAAVQRYLAHLQTLPRDDAHPLLNRLASTWRYTDSWSSRLRSGGFHTNHVHAHGWISSCYYVALPPAITDDAAGAPAHAGWIAFGAPDIEVPGHPMPPLRRVRPQAGRLVLFPSYMWHGTIPFEDDSPRLTVAFDVVPRIR